MNTFRRLEKKLHDTELGTITLRKSDRCKRYTLKVSNGRILATMPLHGEDQKMIDFIREKREGLKQLLLKHPEPPLLEESTILEMASFQMHIHREERKNIRTVLKEGILTVTCPLHVDLKEERIQQLLQEIIENVCRHEAKRLLPERLSRLAKTHGFAFAEVKINNSKTHWGSCTSRKNINLSLYLMKLPWHLIDYVLLHELCHTVEMNHSKRFWELMDKVTTGKALILRKELKEFHTI